MTEAELQAEVRELKRKLRDAELRAGAYEDMLAQVGSEALRVVGCSRLPIDKAVHDRKWRQETYIGRVVNVYAYRAVDVITEALTGDRNEGIVTLEDLQFVPRETIASLRGVGPRAMELLDAAMAERGFAWAEQEVEPTSTGRAAGHLALAPSSPAPPSAVAA